MNGFTDPRIGSVAADIRDTAVDGFVVRLQILRKQSRDSHDHAGLTISALWHLLVDPCLLDRMQLAFA